MHTTSMKYLLVAAGALAAGFLVAGTPVQALLPVVLLLACPLMMVLMMHGMGGHGGHGGHDDRAGQGCHGGHGAADHQEAAPRKRTDTAADPTPR